jgi:Ca2+/H+ antiporter
VLLFVYILYLIFQLKSHAYMYESTPQHVIDDQSHPGVLHVVFDHKQTPVSSEISSVNSETVRGSRREYQSGELPRSLPRSPFVVAFPSQSNQTEQGRAELAVESNRNIVMPTLFSNNVFASNTASGHQRVDSLSGAGNRWSTLAGANAPNPAFPRPVDPSSNALGAQTTTAQAPKMSRTAAVVMLLITTSLVALSAEFLVDAIPEMTKNSPISQAFIGLIVLPIVGNAAEHVTAVTVAMHNKMDLAIGVAVGSSIQIALFVTPAVVLLGWALGKEMTLFFNIFETISLFVTTFVVNFLILDGRSNYMEGALLMSAYVIIA